MARHKHPHQNRKSSGYKRCKNAWKNENLAKFNDIVARYGLEVEQSTLINHAEILAGNQADECGLVEEAFKGGNLFNFIFNCIVFVVGVVAVVFTGGASTAVMAASITAMSASFAVSVGFDLYKAIKQDFVLALSNFKTQMYKTAREWRSEAQQAQAKQRNQITNTLIHAPTAMFPQGALYESGRAGSQTFSPSQAYDANKGILGTNEVINIDEHINNRAQVNLAGGRDFMANLLQIEIPLAQSQNHKEQNAQNYRNQIRKYSNAIQNMFIDLTQEGFGLGKPEVNEIFKQLNEKYINTRIRKICTEDFLEKNKNYNKGLRLEIPLHLRSFLKVEMSEAEKNKLIETMYEHFKEKYEEASNNENATIEEKAQSFIEYASYHLADFVRKARAKNPHTDICNFLQHKCYAGGMNQWYGEFKYSYEYAMYIAGGAIFFRYNRSPSSFLDCYSYDNLIAKPLKSSEIIHRLKDFKSHFLWHDNRWKLHFHHRQHNGLFWESDKESHTYILLDNELQAYNAIEIPSELSDFDWSTIDNWYSAE